VRIGVTLGAGGALRSTTKPGEVFRLDVRAPRLHLPIQFSSVPAGFPSPAQDHEEDRLDLTAHLVRHPDATYFVRAQGDSMTEAGIRDGALLIVDRAIEAVDGHVVVAVVEGSLAVKRLRKRDGRVWLESEARLPAHYAPILVTDPDACVWGVVTAAVNAL